jgi:hypothetical protein
MLLFITVMQKSLTKKWAFSNLISLMQKHLFTYIKFKDFFDNIETIIDDIKYDSNAPNNQLEIQGLTI